MAKLNPLKLKGVINNLCTFATKQIALSLFVLTSRGKSGHRSVL